MCLTASSAITSLLAKTASAVGLAFESNWKSWRYSLNVRAKITKITNRLVCWTRIYSSVSDIRTYCKSTPFENSFAAFQRNPIPQGITEQVQELHNIFEILRIMEAGTADTFIGIARDQLDRILEALFDDTINNLEVTFFNTLMKSVKSYQEVHKVRIIALASLT